MVERGSEVLGSSFHSVLINTFMNIMFLILLHWPLKKLFLSSYLIILCRLLSSYKCHLLLSATSFTLLPSKELISIFCVSLNFSARNYISIAFFLLNFHCLVIRLFLSLSNKHNGIRNCFLITMPHSVTVLVEWVLNKSLGHSGVPTMLELADMF